MATRLSKMAAVAGLLMASSGLVSAGTATTSFTVNITITPECVAGNPTNMNFGSWGYLTANHDANATFTVGCTKGTVPTITLNGGMNFAACTGGTRCMRRGATSDYVNYDLYTDAAGGTAWTTATSTTTVTGTGAVSGTTPTQDNTVTVYGRVPPQNTATPGSYTDTVVATVTF